MALITDPDNLSQGFITTPSDAAWTASSGANTTITGVASLPGMTALDYFEIRDHSVPGNNGLYQATGSPTTSSISCTKITGVNPVNASAETVRFLGRNNAAGDKKMVHFDADARRIHLLPKGNLTNEGVTLQCLYSFQKEEWKDDADLVKHPDPMTGITPESFEIGVDPSGNYNGWRFIDNTTRKLVRTGGWREYDASSNLMQEWVGVVTLGSFEDSVNDNAYYQQGNDPTDTAAGVSFTFAGPVNEPVKSYDRVTAVAQYTSIAITGQNTITRSAGNWITEGYKKGGQFTITGAEDAGNNGTFVIATVTTTVITVSGTPLTNNAADTAMTVSVNDRNVLNVFLRIRDGDTNGKTFAQARLSDIGVTAVDNKVFRYPLSNATDLKIEETDANIVANTPYTEIKVRYFDQAFSIEVDSGTNRDFGIVVDVGTHSGVDGSYTSGGTVLTTAEGGMTASQFNGGVLTVHDGTPDGATYSISTNAAGTITITGGTFPALESNASFTAQRATPVVATAEEIYEKVQYSLRQASDIDVTDQIVTGKTASALLRFVGDTLEAGQATPTNPNGGGSGVIIMGFSANDTNRLTFYDNTAVARNFPFVAAGTINFNANLVNDTNAKYWMFFEYARRKVVSDLAISAASGSTASIDSAGANLPTGLAQNDYVNIQGCTNAANNGIWIITDAAPSTSQFDARKVDGQTVVNEGSGSRTVDDDPIDTPQAIIVNNNAGSPITGTISGASVSFDFDYDNNVQGGRTAATNAPIVLRAIGDNLAQFVQTTGTITRATGLSFSLVAALERNYAT